MNEDMIETLKQEDKHRTQHPYWVWDSIQQIPDMLLACLEGAVSEDIKTVVQACLERSIDKFIFLGRGSSYFAAYAAHFLVEKLTGRPVSCHVTNVFGSYPFTACDSKTAVFFFSHSGKSEGDLEVVDWAKSRSAYTVGVTDIANSYLGKAVDQLLIGPGGAKVELPATRTYATAIFRTMLMAVSFAEALDQPEAASGFRKTLGVMPEKLRHFMTDFEKKAPDVVTTLKDSRTLLVVGFGPNTANADEAAMALNQSSGIPSQSYELENYIHGPMQSLTPDTGVIGIASSGALQSRMYGMLTAARVIGAKTVILAAEDAQVPQADQTILLPAGIPDLLSPVVTMVPLWQIGYHFGLLGQGSHPDRLSMDKPEFKEGFSYLMDEDKWVTKV